MAVEEMVSDGEARAFIAHASQRKREVGVGGIGYTLIQSGDLIRLCETIIALRQDRNVLHAVVASKGGQ